VKLSPSTADLPIGSKLREGIDLARDHLARRGQPSAAATAFDDIAEYTALLARHGGGHLGDARVFEIGYGARPYRLLALLSMGVDASGVDAEVPILGGGLHDYRAAHRRNGIERVAKSLVRRALFDRRERVAFRRELEQRGLREVIDRRRFIVGDAADVDLPPGELDLVFSEDVFEHIRLSSLERLVPRMAAWLAPHGIALIRPNVFTGITGGHLVEWSRTSLAIGRARRRSSPWGHLSGDRFLPNTSLNRLARRDYRQLFQRDFEILDEVVKLPDLGREFLTAAVVADLASHGEDELFSNQVLFVLRPRPRRAG
jgi:hypothetical protein